jgi:hypothetical protein
MPRMFLGDVALQRRLYLAAKPSHVGVDVVGLLSYPSSEKQNRSIRTCAQDV